MATQQPWLGLDLASDAGPGLGVRSVAEQGPLAGQLAPGARLLAIARAGGAGAATLSLTPQDKIEEPDVISDVVAMRAFLRRQGEIAQIVASGPVQLTVQPAPHLLETLGEGATPQDLSGTTVSLTVQPQSSRPLTDLPLVFWVQIGVGLFGATLGAWVLGLRRNDRAVQLFVLAGFGLLIAAHTAALYSTRELALPHLPFTAASRLNFLGSILFGIGMINLFLLYPAKLARPWVLWVVAIGFGLSITKVLTDATTLMGDRQLPIALAMLILLGAIVAQVVANRRRPAERAILGWFGLSVLLGAGGFVTTVVLPVLLGHTPQISQGYAFLFFLVIYAGLALGVARFRLFDLAGWSFRILFYLGGVLLLLALDAALIYLLALERAAALGLSLAVVGLAYLPLRDQIGRWLRPDPKLGTQDLFSLVNEITLSTTLADQTEAQRLLVQSLFDPLRIDQFPSEKGGRARLLDGGEGLDMPMPSGLPTLRLFWAQQGRRLFSMRDVQLADSLIAMLDRSIARQRGYDQAVEEERRRINRDMHDNIGVQLLGALHSTDPERKNGLIRQTLADLRQIISTPGHETQPLSRLLADLRAEISEHFEAAGLRMTWQAPALPEVTLSPQTVQTLRAILREASSNVMRHAKADQVRITLDAREEGEDIRLSVTVSDNGCGLATGAQAPGSGLRNLTYRVEASGGAIKIDSTKTGTRLKAHLLLGAPGQSARGAALPAIALAAAPLGGRPPVLASVRKQAAQ
jgi:two-component system, NarL family, sensor histidine kinase DevS